MDILAFIDDRPVRISGPGAIPSPGERYADLSTPYSPDEISLLVLEFEQGADTPALLIRTADIRKTWEAFCSLYTIMEAAGGLVKNSKGKLLMIFRNGKWDLPKGKIEAGEAPDDAAVREVAEECGIRDLKIIRPASVSYHTYPYKDKKVLKRTYWYLMSTTDEGEPVPQLEEGISKAAWKGHKGMETALSKSYRSINWLLRESLD